MNVRNAGREPQFLARASVLVVSCTVVLTVSFIGIVALITGNAFGIGNRLPVYVLSMACTFAATIVRLDPEYDDGKQVLGTAVVFAVSSFVLVSLGGEGVAYAVRRPGQVLTSQLFLYFVSAGLIGTGLGYWGARHWRELTRKSVSKLN
jgi:FtsH-binding integral membrane protein